MLSFWYILGGGAPGGGGGVGVHGGVPRVSGWGRRLLRGAAAQPNAQRHRGTATLCGLLGHGGVERVRWHPLFRCPQWLDDPALGHHQHHCARADQLHRAQTGGDVRAGRGDGDAGADIDPRGLCHSAYPRRFSCDSAAIRHAGPQVVDAGGGGAGALRCGGDCEHDRSDGAAGGAHGQEVDLAGAGSKLSSSTLFSAWRLLGAALLGDAAEARDGQSTEFMQPAAKYAANDKAIDDYSVLHPNAAQADVAKFADEHEPHSSEAEWDAIKNKVMARDGVGICASDLRGGGGIGVRAAAAVGVVNTVIGGMISVCYVMLLRDNELPHFFTRLNLFGVPWVGRCCRRWWCHACCS